MRKISVLAVMALFGTASVVWACDKHKEAKAVLASAKTASFCQTTFDNAVAGVMKTMPAMAYRVGDTDTHCFKSATAKAGTDGKVRFLVAGTAFDTETEATIALAGLLEKEIENLKTVQLSAGGKCYGCPMSAQAALKDGEKMKYRLAGFDFATQEDAEKALKIVNCKLKGCDADCIKDCMKNFRGTALTAGAKKSGCNKAKAAAATVAAKDGSPCPHALGAGAALAGAKKSGCNKAKAAAATVAAKDGSPCPHALGAGAALAGAKKSGCNKAKAATVAAAGSPCSKSKAAKVTTVAAESKGGCCKTAQKRLATAQDQIELIVKAAATMALSS